jgi:hypothetical protein
MAWCLKGVQIEGRVPSALELVVDKIDEPVNPTHHAFGQLAQLAKAPAYYLRTVPSPIAADCFNYGLRFKREIDAVRNTAGLTSDQVALRRGLEEAADLLNPNQRP